MATTTTPAKTAISLPYGWMVSDLGVACWPIDDVHALELEPVERTDDYRIRWWYRLSADNEEMTIFEGDDICSAVGAVVTTDEYAWTARCVLLPPRSIARGRMGRGPPCWR